MLEVELEITLSREEDGRFIAELRALPGAIAYGATPDEAVARVQAVALRVRAEDLLAKRRPLAAIRFRIAAASPEARWG
jgi:predicted RNase H-like HicB family nuclease